jgi:MAF protein
VCANDFRFLNFSQKVGNDLITPLPEVGFPGLKPGDFWCICVTRWVEAYEAGHAPPIKLNACHNGFALCATEYSRGICGLMNQFELILASSSQTRKDLMDRLRLDYRCISPDIDESAMGELHADDLAKRLAYEKARVIAEQNPNAIVIGSDQVAWREHAPYDFIGKPLSVENAIQQLQENSGKIVFFSTALSVQHLQSGFETTLVEHYQVKFRQLTLAEIERYIEIDQPLHCRQF